MTTRYERGRAQEYRALRDLQAEGYTATRTAGSHGTADIIAWDADTVRFIQIKSFIDRPDGYKADIEALRTMTVPPHATKELWVHRHNTRGWWLKHTIITTEHCKDDTP